MTTITYTTPSVCKTCIRVAATRQIPPLRSFHSKIEHRANWTRGGGQLWLHCSWVGEFFWGTTVTNNSHGAALCRHRLSAHLGLCFSVAIIPRTSKISHTRVWHQCKNFAAGQCLGEKHSSLALWSAWGQVSRRSQMKVFHITLQPRTFNWKCQALNLRRSALRPTHPSLFWSCFLPNQITRPSNPYCCFNWKQLPWDSLSYHLPAENL